MPYILFPCFNSSEFIVNISLLITKFGQTSWIFFSICSNMSSGIFLKHGEVNRGLIAYFYSSSLTLRWINFSYNSGIFWLCFLKSCKYSESRICSIVILSSGFLFKHPLTISWISSSVYTGRSLYLQSRMFYFIYSSERLMKGESPVYNS